MGLEMGSVMMNETIYQMRGGKASGNRGSKIFRPTVAIPFSDTLVSHKHRTIKAAGSLKIV